MSDNPLSGKVGLDTTEFKAAVVQLNREIRVIESGFRSVAAGMGDWDKTSAGLEARIEALTKQIDLQSYKVGRLQKEYDKVAAEKGATSRAAQDLLIKLNKETEILNKMQGELGQTEKALHGMGKEEKNAGKQADDLNRSSDRAAGAIRGLAGALRGLGGAVRGAGAGIANLTKNLAGMAARAAAGVATVATAATVAAGMFLASTIAPASDLGETVSKVGVVFGEQAAAVLAFGETADTALGMSKNAALAAAGTYGNLFRSMGMAEETSADMSIGLVQLAGDLASFNNMDPTEVLEKLRAGLTGETEPLKSLGVNLSAATIEAKAFEMGFKKVNGALPAAAKAQASYALIMQQTSLAQGDFERTSGGLANQQRILKAQFENLKATLGGGLLPVVTQAATALNGMLASDKLQGAASAISGALGPLASTLSNLFGGDARGAMLSFSTALSGLAPLFGLTSSEGAALGLTIGKAFGPLGDTVGRLVGYVTQLFGVLTGSGGDLSKMGEGVGGLFATILSDMGTNRAGMIEAGLGLVTGLVNGLVGAIPTLLPVALRLITSLVQFITQSLPVLLQAGMQIITGLIQGILPQLPLLLQSGITILTTLINGVVSMLPMLIETALQLMITLALGIAQALPTLIPTVIEIIPQIITTLLTNLPLLISAALELIIALATGLVNALPTLIAAVPQIVQAIFDTILVSLPIIADAALQLIGTLATGIIDNLPQIGETAVDIVWAIAQGLENLREDILAVGFAILEGVWEGISGNIDWFLTNVMGFFGGLVVRIKELLGIASPSKVFAGIGANMALGLGAGFTRSFRDVARDVEGAIGGMAGGISTPAWSSRTSRQAAAAGQPIQITVQATVNGELDEYRLARRVAEELGRMR